LHEIAVILRACVYDTGLIIRVSFSLRPIPLSPIHSLQTQMDDDDRRNTISPTVTEVYGQLKTTNAEDGWRIRRLESETS